jgi:uncharacterized protein (DUF1778 family)
MDNPKKDKQLGLRISEEDRALIGRAARKARRIESEWARLTLVDRARAEVAGETMPAREPDEEEEAALAALRSMAGTDPSLPVAVLRLGTASMSRAHLARALKELDAAIQEDALAGTGGRDRAALPQAKRRTKPGR